MPSTCCLCRAFSRLPPAEHLPLCFEEVTVGDTRMQRTVLPGSSGNPMPFFLGLAQHAELLAYAHPRALGGPSLLALTGPVKCGKSTVQRDVLPALIVQEHSRSGLPDARPFIVNFTFSVKSSPASAAQKLESALCDAVAGLGVKIIRHAFAEDALLQLPATVASAAKAVRATGRSLWLLLDECQVSFFRARLGCLLVFVHSRGAQASAPSARVMLFSVASKP